MVLCLVLSVVLIISMAVKIFYMKKAVREIAMQFNEKLTQDTNTLIAVSSSDADICLLASSINEQLKVLRAEHIKYYNGDVELKTAVTNISHDLRTPLTAICGYLDFLKAEKKSEQVEKYLDIISERTNALKLLSEELMQYSSAISGIHDLLLEDIHINAVLEESILSYQAALQEKGIFPDIDITDTKVVRKADRLALSRIFANLLNNAMKYSDGDLFISMNDDAIIKFRNSAAILDPLQVNRLFDRFYTVECGGRSTGLGLSISRMLVEQMNGCISADYHENILEITISF